MILYAMVGVGILVYGILRLLEAVVRHQRDQNRSYVIRVDGDAGTYELERRRLTRNEIRSGKSDDGKIEILQGGARLTGDKGSLFLIHKRHGWNLRVPRDAEVFGSELMRALAICNPASYYQAEKRNDARDSLDANQEPEPWYGKLAVPLLIIGVAAIGMLGYLVLKVQGA